MNSFGEKFLACFLSCIISFGLMFFAAVMYAAGNQLLASFGLTTVLTVVSTGLLGGVVIYCVLDPRAVIGAANE